MYIYDICLEVTQKLYNSPPVLFLWWKKIWDGWSCLYHLRLSNNELVEKSLELKGENLPGWLLLWQAWGEFDFLTKKISLRYGSWITLFCFQTSSSRTRSFSTFSRVISDNARKVLQYTTVRTADLTGNNNSDFNRGPVEIIAILSFFTSLEKLQL